MPSLAAIESCVHPKGPTSALPPASTPQTASTSRAGCLSLRKWGDIDLKPDASEASPRVRVVRLPSEVEPETDATAQQRPSAAPADEADGIATPDDMTMDEFLDKLMHAESAGKLKAKNPRSTALGPYQFIDSTFLSLVKRHFEDEIDGMSVSEILALRTDREFARRAVEIFTNENAEYMKAQGVEVTYPGLRLAHLLGPAGAVQALKAAPSTALPKVFSQAVLRANPFMKRLTVAGLVRRAERELGLAPRDDEPAVATTKEADSGKSGTARREAKPSGKRTAPSRAAKRLTERSAARARKAASACKGRAGSCSSKVATTGRKKVRYAGS